MQSSPTITLTQRRLAPPNQPVQLMLALTAEERTRSRHRFTTTTGQPVFLQLPRGTVLQDGDVLESDDGLTVQVIAKPEPVLTVTANSPLELLQAAYHLGNRHVALEIQANYLRLSPDSVLHNLLIHRGLIIHEEMQPFQPEGGAYGSHTHESQSHIHHANEPTPTDPTHGGHSH